MKRIVICADGTWNHRDQINKKTGKRHPTNVTKVARAVRPRSAAGVDQVVFYHEGVGTGGGLDKYTGGAFGRGLEINIRVLYRALVYNHEPGDELYLFGFSRGAFTVRSLVGFMNLVGLVQKEDDYYVPELYACYENNWRRGSAQWDKAFRGVRKPRPCPPIRFIGVWDTVGALGAPGILGQVFNRKKYQYHDPALRDTVEHAYHALAIDERRRPFLPNVWTRPDGWRGELVQAWFAGVHSNVGGGYSPDGVANEPLHWMVEKAEALGLDFDPAFLDHFTPCFNTPLEDSMSFAYRLMRPCDRTIGEHAVDCEVLHQSVLDRLNHTECAYGPRNLKRFLEKAATPTVVTTTRIQRTRPCEPLPPDA